MLRSFRIANRQPVGNQIFISRTAIRKFLLILFLALLSTVPLWSGLEQLNSARAVRQGPAVDPVRAAVVPGPPPTACFSAPKSMVAWWPLDEPNGATTVNDLVGFNNLGTAKPGTVGAGNSPSAIAGMVSGAMNFNSALQTNGPYIEVPNHPEINFASGDFSIDAWVFVPKPPAIYLHPIVDKLSVNSAGTVGTGYSFSLVSSFAGSARLQFVMGTGGPLATYLGGSSPSVPFNTWTHVAVAVNRGAGTVAFFVNGVQFTPAGPAMPAGSTNNNLPLLIGESRLPGLVQAAISLDEIEMFTRSLMQNEINGIANAGKFGKCKCLRASNENVSCNAQGTFSYTFTLTNLSSAPISQVNFSSSSSVTITPSSLIISPLPSGASTTVTVTISGTAAVSGATICFSMGLAGPASTCKVTHCLSLPKCHFAGCAKPPPGMISWWPLDETSGNTVIDILGAHHGITSAPIGSDPSPTAPKVGSALYFINSKATVPGAPYNFGTGNFSIDAWVRGPVSNAALGIVDKLDTSNPIKTGFAFFIRNGSLQLVMGNGLSTATFSSPLTFNYGVWQHVAVTIQRVGLGSPIGRFYLNGVQVSTFVPAASSVNNASNLLLGNYHLNVGCSSCEVALDEIEIFKDAISPVQIKDIFLADQAGKCK